VIDPPLDERHNAIRRVKVLPVVATLLRTLEFQKNDFSNMGGAGV
jgi:hypothetical protein